jgi:hypothetical protein
MGAKPGRFYERGCQEKYLPTSRPNDKTRLS